MLKKSSAVRKIEKKIKPILVRNGVKRAGIFGSYSRGDQKKDSDVDILVEMKGSLLDLVGLEIELKKILRMNVDLLTYKGVNPFLKKQILAEEVRII